MTSDDSPRLRPRAAELAASLAPKADRLLLLGLRSVGAIGLSLVPGVGAAVQEMISSHRERQAAKNFDLFAGRVELLEDQMESISGADKYLQSRQGQEHVTQIFEQVCRADGERHSEALASAYVSGAGYGRFRPDVVLLLDATLARLNEYHVQVLRWCYEKQGGLTLQDRLRTRLQVRALADEVAVPGAVVQKIVGDLIDARILMDGGLNKLGGYWGALSFALTSFGMNVAVFISSPETFVRGEPELESPFPP